MPEEDLKHPKTDDEILRKVKGFWADGVAGDSEFFDRMRKAEDFVIGEQWPPEVKEAARLDNKFTLTIPIIKPQINQIAGAEIQNPQDFIIENTKGGTATVAKILTALTKQAADSERARYEKSQTFRSGLQSGQGVIGVFKDKTDDPKHANLRIERLIEHDVMSDPNASSYNINKLTTGAKYVIWREWEDQEFTETEYPDKAEELKAGGQGSSVGVVMGAIESIIDWATGRRSTREIGSFGTRERTDIDVMVKSRYAKIHTWWREPKKIVHWYDNRESELDAVILYDDKEIAAAKKATKANPDTFSIEEVTSYVMHHTIRVADVFLEDRINEFNGVQMFPLNFYWPYWINGYKSGIAEDLIGTQEEINWSHSMALNLIKQLANTGWIINEDPEGTYEDFLESHSGKDGIILNKSKAGGSIEKIDSPNFKSAQFETFTKGAMDNVKTITGRLDLPESDPKALSGRAKFLDIQKTQQGSMSILNNWFYTLTILGDLITDIIRKNDIFSEDEIRETVDKEDLLDPEILEQAKQIVLQNSQQAGVEMMQQPEEPNPITLEQATPGEQAFLADQFKKHMELFSQFVDQVEQMAVPIAEAILIDMIHSMKKGKYSTKVTTSPMGETMRAIKALEIFELQKLLIESQDIGLDAEDLIEATDVPNKEKLIQGRRDKLASLTGVA